MKNYAEILKEHGLKATFQRMTILSVIEKMGHASVDEIYESVCKSHPTLSLATVYKNILTMVSNSVLVEVPIAGRKSKYELKKEDHIHFICSICGSVIDHVVDGTLAEYIAQVAESAAFALHGHQLNLYGKCSNCIQAEKS